MIFFWTSSVRTKPRAPTFQWFLRTFRTNYGTRTPKDPVSGQGPGEGCQVEKAARPQCRRSEKGCRCSLESLMLCLQGKECFQIPRNCTLLERFPRSIEVASSRWWGETTSLLTSKAAFLDNMKAVYCIKWAEGSLELLLNLVLLSRLHFIFYVHFRPKCRIQKRTSSTLRTSTQRTICPKNWRTFSSPALYLHMCYLAKNIMSSVYIVSFSSICTLGFSFILCELRWSLNSKSLYLTSSRCSLSKCVCVCPQIWP